VGEMGHMMPRRQWAWLRDPFWHRFLSWQHPPERIPRMVRMLMHWRISQSVLRKIRQKSSQLFVANDYFHLARPLLN